MESHYAWSMIDINFEKSLGHHIIGIIQDQ